ncbi:MAG: ATP-binding protein [Elusimicrobiota bacterium]
MKIKLLYKFIIVLVLISVVPLSIVGFKMVNINKVTLEEAILYKHTNTAEFLAGGIDSFVMALREKLLFLISAQSIQTLDNRTKETLIKSLLSSSDYFISVSVLNAEGQEILKAYNQDYVEEAKIRDLAGSELFKKAAGGAAVGDVYENFSEPRIDVIYPVHNEYVYVSCTLAKLWKDIRDTSIGKKADVFLVDSSGKILCHTDPAMEGEISAIPPVRAVLERASLGSMEYGGEENRMVGAYAPVESMGWGMVTQQPYGFAYESAIEMRNNANRWIIIAIVLAVIVSYILAMGLTGPIFKLIKGASKVADGDFDSTVIVNTGDELEMLSDTFNSMVISLKNYDEMQIDRIIAEKTKTESIVFSIEDGIVLTDFNGKIMLVNDRARELLDIEKNPAEDDDIFDYIKGKELVEVFKDVREAEIELFSGEKRKVIKAITKDVMTTKGKNIGKMRIIRDITLEKEIEEVRDTFINSITHDLRNPISSMIGTLDIITNGMLGPVNEKQLEFLNNVKRSSKRLERLANDILDAAKVDAGRLELELEETDFREVVEEVVMFMQWEATERNQDLKSEFSGEFGRIFIDRDMLYRILINLVGNAMKFVPRGGSVTIKAVGKEEFIEVAIIDTGSGIPPEYIDRIFDKYQQVEGEMKRRGTGLGLFICKEVVRAHLGEIWAESEEDKGTSIIFRIPWELKKTKDGGIFVGEKPENT